MVQYAYGSPIEPQAILSKWRNDYSARLSGPRMMLQKKCKKYYGDSSKNITFSLLSNKKLAKML
jgi:hypothetical protein